VLSGGAFRVVTSLLADLTSRVAEVVPRGQPRLLDVEPAMGAVRLAVAEARGGRGFPRTCERRKQESVDVVRVRILKDEGAVARSVASQVAALIAERPDAVLGLPTGRTPIGLYAELRERHAAERSTSRACARSTSTSSSGCRPIIRPATGRSWTRTCSGTSTCRGGTSTS
jgi:hypothetical protein